MPRTTVGRIATGRTTCQARNWRRSTGERRGTDRGGRWSRKPRVMRFIQRRPLRIAQTRRSTDRQNPPPFTSSIKRFASSSRERSRPFCDIRVSVAPAGFHHYGSVVKLTRFGLRWPSSARPDRGSPGGQAAVRRPAGHSPVRPRWWGLHSTPPCRRARDRSRLGSQRTSC